VLSATDTSEANKDEAAGTPSRNASVLARAGAYAPKAEPPDSVAYVLVILWTLVAMLADWQNVCHMLCTQSTCISDHQKWPHCIGPNPFPLQLQQ